MQNIFIYCNLKLVFFVLSFFTMNKISSIALAAAILLTANAANATTGFYTGAAISAQKHNITTTEDKKKHKLKKTKPVIDFFAGYNTEIASKTPLAIELRAGLPLGKIASEKAVYKSSEAKAKYQLGLFTNLGYKFTDYFEAGVTAGLNLTKYELKYEDTLAKEENETKKKLKPQPEAGIYLKGYLSDNFSVRLEGTYAFKTKLPILKIEKTYVKKRDNKGMKIRLAGIYNF